MPLSEAQIGTIVTVVGQFFSPKDPGLYLLVLTRVGLDMSKIVRLNGTFYDHVLDLVMEINRRRALRVFVQAVLDKLPGNPVVQSSLTPLLLDIELEDAHPAQTVALGLSGLQASMQQDATVQAAARGLKTSLTELSDDISKLHAYKLLHDCLHRLPPLMKIIEPAIRNSSAPTFKLTAAQCQTELQSLVNLGRSVLNGIPVDLAAERKTEQEWLNELADISDKLGVLSKNLLVPGPLPESPMRPNPLGIQIIYRLRSLHRVQPSRIDGELTSCAGTLDLERLEKLFQQIIDLPATNDAEKSSLRSACASLNQINLQIYALIHRHQHWQKIDKDLGSAEEQFPRNADQPGDFPALWEGVRDAVANMIMIEPNAEVSTTLSGLSSSIDSLGLNDWSATKEAFETHRAWCMIYFFSVDTELKDKCQEAAAVGTSLRNLLANL